MALGETKAASAYGITEGKVLVGGVAYDIAQGKTLVNGVAYDIGGNRQCTITVTGASGSNMGVFTGFSGSAGNTMYTELTVDRGTTVYIACPSSRTSCYLNGQSLTLLNRSVGTGTRYYCELTVTGDAAVAYSSANLGRYTCTITM